jgi:parvulin-like peptidyl-prolyl isomerase
VRRILGVLALGLSAAACQGSRSQAAPGSPAPSADPNAPLPHPIPTVVARVNDRPVYLLDIVPLAKPALDKAPDREQAKPAALRGALQLYIDREVLFQEAQARGLKADDRQVEQAYNQVRLAHPDEQEWNDELKRQGFDPESFRTELRIQATLARLTALETAKITEVTDAEAEAYYDAHREDFRRDEVRVRHILVRTLPTSSPEQRAGLRAKAEGLRARILHGESLASLAKALSDDEASRGKGGELPKFGLGQAAAAFEAAAFALKPGELSPVVESPAGFHILELIERIPGGLPPYDSVQDGIKRRLLEQKREQAMRDLTATLRARARVQTYL